jgi:cell division protein FtsI (penicillin-binding protein 3)
MNTMVQRRKGAAKDAAARYGEFPGEIQRVRMAMLTRVLALAFAVIVARLVQLHLSPSHQLSEEERNHIGTVPIYEPRGDIVDRNGLTLATDRKVPSVWADPRYITDPDSVAGLVAKHLGMDRNDVYGKLTQRGPDGEFRKFVWLKRWLTDVSEEALREMEEVSDGAITVQYEPLRFYPQKDMAAHLIGFCNRDGEAGEGAELFFDKDLRSTPGKYTARKDGRRRMLGSLTLDYEEPQGGADVVLTIDGKVQHNLEQTLDQRMLETNAPRAMGIVMDPHTGGIIALACRPAYDPNQYDTTDPELRKNRAIIDVFEPGSVFKIVTAAAALEHDLINTETMINCENGGFSPYGHYIRDYHKLGVEPFRHCFAESSNVALIKVAAMLGPERLDQWIQRFGFGKPASHEFRGRAAACTGPTPKAGRAYRWDPCPWGRKLP